MTSLHAHEIDPAVFDTDGARLAAVRRRDPAADGLFVYAVRSTGVYCRPCCAARPALARNIAFHPDAAAAEAAGFRACKRCRPDLAASPAGHRAAIEAACRRLERDDAATPSLQRLAAEANLSPFHFHRLFKAATGVTPKAYAEAARARRVEARLRSAPSVTDALYAAGFNAPSRFYAPSGARLGMTPTAYRAGGAGATIRFATGPCSLGTVLVAATDRGVCAILLGESTDALVADLRARFDRATLVGGDPAFAAVVARAVDLVEAPGQHSDLPLDIGGTAFQQRVWQALRAIPSGRTASYAEVAAAIGQPSATRAVARACAANPIAVAVPCHRVVRADGSLAGYRWGADRKRALLAREAAGAAAEASITSRERPKV